MRTPWPALLALLLALCVHLPGMAQAQQAVEIPPALQAWVPWVMHGHERLNCARSVDDEPRCSWPGLLEVQAGDTQGDFTMLVWLDQPGLVRLPGHSQLWPQQVTEEGKPLVLRQWEEAPAVHLERGPHRIQGRLLWPRPPQLLPIDPRTGVIALQVGDKVISHPRLDEEGRLWLQSSGPQEGDAADSLRVSTYRRVYDGVPMRIENRFDLNVSGRAREVNLGKVFLLDARPVAVRSELPVQLTPQGELKAYVRPGSHTISIDTVLTQPAQALRAPAQPSDSFDPQEVWVWKPDEVLRSVELEGLPSIDPERTSLPESWRGATTYLAEPGKALTLRQTRRGEVETPPNVLRANRTLWLDLDGRGYTVRDQVSGTMHQGWRLNYSPEAQLGRVSQGSDDLLITQDPGASQQGVELREAQVNLQAELRLEEARGSFQAVGWDHDVQQLSARVHLPPGWELLGGQGVDQMRGTWIESWTLFDFFFLLMVALALGKLCGWRWAPLAALALCLSHGHGDAPRWVWIQLLASLALLRVLPDGWVRRGVLLYRGLVLVTLLVLLAPYARDQIRFALHPQVAYGGGSPQSNSAQWAAADDNGGFGQDMLKSEDQMVQSSAALEEEMEREISRSYEKKPMSKLKQRSKGDGKDGWYAQKQLQLQQIDPNAVVQTGPGLPHWEWRHWDLQWSGPVRRDHEVSLWLLSPTWNRLATLLRVALLIALALLMIGRKDMTWQKTEEQEEPSAPPRSFWRHLMGRGGLLLLLGPASLLLAQPDAQAQVPQQQINNLGNVGLGNDDASKLGLGNGGPLKEGMLEELRKRLVEAQECQGPCLVASRADIEVSGYELTLKAEVHAQRPSAWTLPGPADPLQIVQVLVNGEPTRQLRREESGLTSVRLPAGRNLVTLKGRLVQRNVITLQLGEEDKPHLVTFRGEGWSVDGLSTEGVPDSSLQLTRSQDARGESPSGPNTNSAELPPWYQVRRELALGLPWQIRTEVRREDNSRPQLVKLPLIEGEKVITEGVRVEQGMALVDFPRGEDTVVYTSEIPIVPELTLSAAQDQPWTETWAVECSRMWRCSFDGLPPVASVSSSKVLAPQWRPWPGETLKVEINRPEGTPGQARTVEQVRYTVTPGKRLLEARLHMTVRASQGGWQKVTLPEGAELQSVSLGGAARNIRPSEGVVQLPLQPGKQEMELVWQQPWERELIEHLPVVKLDSQAVNAHMTLNLGEDRWLLWTMGPAWGPAVLYWSHLVVLFLIALLLGRLQVLPLRTWEWLLLALGMAQLPVVALLPVVLWFVALAWRRWDADRPWWHFNLRQLILVGLTLIALISMYAAIHANLLFDPDMQVTGAGSSNHALSWYTDRVEGQLPEAGIISAPLLAWRLAMLLWALWLVTRLLKWVPWGWRAFSHTGLWRPITKNDPPADPPQAQGEPQDPPAVPEAT